MSRRYLIQGISYNRMRTRSQLVSEVILGVYRYAISQIVSEVIRSRRVKGRGGRADRHAEGLATNQELRIDS